MQIGTLARRLGTTTATIRFYERSGVVPRAQRGPNGYREYTDADADRLRLLIGLRQLDLSRDQLRCCQTCAAPACVPRCLRS